MPTASSAMTPPKLPIDVLHLIFVVALDASGTDEEHNELGKHISLVSTTFRDQGQATVWQEIRIGEGHSSSYSSADKIAGVLSSPRLAGHVRKLSWERCLPPQERGADRTFWDAEREAEKECWARLLASSCRFTEITVAAEDGSQLVAAMDVVRRSSSLSTLRTLAMWTLRPISLADETSMSSPLPSFSALRSVSATFAVSGDAPVAQHGPTRPPSQLLRLESVALPSPAPFPAPLLLFGLLDSQHLHDVSLHFDDKDTLQLEWLSSRNFPSLSQLCIFTSLPPRSAFPPIAECLSALGTLQQLFIHEDWQDPSSADLQGLRVLFAHLPRSLVTLDVGYIVTDEDLSTEFHLPAERPPKLCHIGKSGAFLAPPRHILLISAPSLF
ncbi:hypothetical protein JCM11641_007271 [Rhodosporidiobolus odoratus]